MKEDSVLWWMGPLNEYAIQWFGFRMAVDVSDSGDVSSYGVLGPVAPMSGWDGRPYKALWFRVRYVRLWPFGKLLRTSD